MRPFGKVLPLAAFALTLSATAPALASPGLTVAIDHSARLSVARPAGSVIVGNPQVADVTVVDSHTVYVSGRGYGVSEVVVLDQLGRPVWQGDVVVTAPTDGQVTVYHGNQVTEMACASVCSPSVRTPKSSGSAGGAGSGSGGGSSSGGAAFSPALPAPSGAPHPTPML